MLFILAPQAESNASEYSENQIKLAFIFKVLDFIDDFPAQDDKLTLCLYGFNTDEVKVISQDIDYSKHSDITLTNQPNRRSSQTCNILYFRQDYADYKNILDYIKNAPILSFAEIKYFTDHGGMVEFYKYKGKYKFIINNELAIKKNISFNAKLLEISK
ncbi:MAG: YfiR family protein [Rickettsiales bacterium]|nr:YfiR family protein [Rickettsiales bacterium]